MRDQYAGDISDYLKFAFLRAVTPADDALGVAWYYVTGHDGRPDGRHDEYLSDARWRHLDPALFETLNHRTHRSVAELEAAHIFDRLVVFHRVPVPAKKMRDVWFDEVLKSLVGCETIFVDPDNGVSRPGVVSRKSATVREVEQLCGHDRLVLLIRFPHRLATHEHQLVRHHDTFRAFHPITLRTCVRVPNSTGSTSPRIRWFTALNGRAEVGTRMELFAERLSQLPGVTAKLDTAARR